MALISSLAAIVGAANCSEDPTLLQGYAGDHSLVQARQPDAVAYPEDADQIQAVMRLAGAEQIPVTPRSSAVGLNGAGIPSQGGIILDLRRMNRILEVDQRNKKIKVEPGVTWTQAQRELEPSGMMVCSPLLPHPEKSVLTSALEREPLLIPKSEYSEALQTAEVVLANGDRFWTGTAMGKGMTGQCFPDAIIPGTRLFLGSQGTFGIVTWANIKIEPIPAQDRVCFLPFQKVEEVVVPLYRVQRVMLGSECFVMHRTELATILAAPLQLDFESLRASLPPWTLVLVLSGTHRFPEDRIAYEAAALADLAKELNFAVLPTLADVPDLGAKLIPLLRHPYPDQPYWKFRHGGARQDIFFNTTLERAPEFTAAVLGIATEHGYDAERVGVYLQPQDRARHCWCSYGFSYDPSDAAATEQVRHLFLAASQRVVNMGGLFATPYGPWAGMVYTRSAGYTRMLRVVKDALDPDHLLNPGKLCF